jgi:hypothetical protein
MQMVIIATSAQIEPMMINAREVGDNGVEAERVRRLRAGIL